MTKSLIRQEMCEKRKSISQDERQKSSLQATRFFLQHPFLSNSHKIGLYLSTAEEFSTRLLVEEILKSKRGYLPVVNKPAKGQMSFVSIEDLHTLQNNYWDVLEPKWDPAKAVKAEKLDMVIVPLLAFDVDGTRLGRGGGYYDRAFQFLNSLPRPARPFLCGWAYHFQEYLSLPKDAWDIPLDAVVTDQYFLNCSSQNPTEKKIFYEI